MAASSPKLWTHQAGPQAEWLAKTAEEVLEPELPIIDPHHHLFLAGSPMKHWVVQPRRGIPGKYFVEEISADVNSGHRVLATVYAECQQFYRTEGEEKARVVGESEVVQGVAHLGDRGLYGPCHLCAGIVATADLSLGRAALEPVLRAHLAAAPNLRGVRYLGGRVEQTPFRSEAFVDSVRLLAELGLSLDINGPETHPLNFEMVLGGVLELARAVPKATIILDHCGGAVGPAVFAGTSGPAGAERLEVWRKLMQQLAECENVVVKVGGATMSINGFGFEQREAPPGSEELCAALLPYYGFVLDTFGPRRCMFESNFPMDKVSCSYTVLWNMFKRLARAKGLSDAGKHEVFYGTAQRVYRLRDFRGAAKL